MHWSIKLLLCVIVILAITGGYFVYTEGGDMYWYTASVLLFGGLRIYQVIVLSRTVKKTLQTSLGEMKVKPSDGDG